MRMTLTSRVASLSRPPTSPRRLKHFVQIRNLCSDVGASECVCMCVCIRKHCHCAGWPAVALNVTQMVTTETEQRAKLESRSDEERGGGETLGASTAGAKRRLDYTISIDGF